jgi:hypothetical protein
MAKELELWDRQPGETPKSFAAFCTYRALGIHERSYQKVAESIPSEKSRTGYREVSQIKTWAGKYNWVARVGAFDAEQQRVGLLEQEQTTKDMYGRYARVGFELFRKLAQRIEGDEEEGVKAIDPELLSAQDLRTLGELAIKFETLQTHEEKDKSENKNRPITVTLAFDGTPRFPDDRGDTLMPESSGAPLELVPGPEPDDDLPEAA